MLFNARAERLFVSHRQDAVRLAYLLTADRHAAEDVAQDAFIRVFARFGDLRQPEAFLAYLRRTIVNLSKDHHRKTARERSAVETLGRLEITRTDDGAPLEGNGLMKAAQMLPRRQFVALVLRHCEGLSELETAEVLGSSVSAVKSLTNRGLATLRQNMESFHE